MLWPEKTILRSSQTLFSPGGNARSIYEMGSGINCLLVALPGLLMLRLLLISGVCQSETIELFIKYLYVQVCLSAVNISYQSTYRATNKYSQVFD